MTPLKRLLLDQIARTGPMPLNDYMGACLFHPEHGVYAAADPLGAAGHFTTSPEISQMFGELLGLALGQAWMDQGAPPRIVLAELGPGRGTLMEDALRALSRVPGFLDAAELHLVEASPALRAEQERRLGQATWHESVGDLPEAPLFLVANEFFDALPIRQFQRQGGGWAERVVGAEGDRLALGLTPPAPLAGMEERLEDTAEGDVVELCPSLPAITGEIGRRVAAHGGAALIVDYGDWRSQGDTLQALSRHERADPFEAPGTADLTAHVDFEQIARAASPARHSRLTWQGTFLDRLGIGPRAKQLAAKLEGEALDRHLAALRRLTHPDEMGHLFKVIGLHPPESAPPPGLEP
ncbi:class I SAM-dependent methyltransferase [Histidinibacterium aquaticum]|uniref:Class I SAM-dependent methyltransferase n=1 Tax=Histidinibacterium aquaticum TaxID=2613962 RepID=A0A5J5GJ80_9RHOB|nr:SAM-dependent methyltransferase [Histidinibacterium aquaticum]KAA9008205.1 class I SAM-dependent methyltransferase [Histidinibacterium aquaticum]